MFELKVASERKQKNDPRARQRPEGGRKGGMAPCDTWHNRILFVSWLSGRPWHFYITQHGLSGLQDKVRAQRVVNACMPVTRRRQKGFLPAGPNKRLTSPVIHQLKTSLFWVEMFSGCIYGKLLNSWKKEKKTKQARRLLCGFSWWDWMVRLPATKKLFSLHWTTEKQSRNTIFRILFLKKAILSRFCFSSSVSWLTSYILLTESRKRQFFVPSPIRNVFVRIKMSTQKMLLLPRRGTS